MFNSAYKWSVTQLLIKFILYFLTLDRLKHQFKNVLFLAITILSSLMTTYTYFPLLVHLQTLFLYNKMFPGVQLRCSNWWTPCACCLLSTPQVFNTIQSLEQTSKINKDFILIMTIILSVWWSMTYPSVIQVNFLLQLLFIIIHTNCYWPQRQLPSQYLHHNFCNTYPWSKIWIGQHLWCCLWPTPSLTGSAVRSIHYFIQTQKIFDSSLVVYPHKQVLIELKSGAKLILHNANPAHHVNFTLLKRSLIT